jgi:hypothetical protein
MHIVLITGGLGNQMSQYAFFVAKKNISSSTIANTYIERRHSAHNGYELERVFGIHDYKNVIVDNIVRYTRKLVYLKDKYLLKYLIRPVIYISKSMGIHIIFDNKNGEFDYKFLENRPCLNVYYGGWLSEKYFKGLELNIRRTFSFDLNKLSKQSLNIMGKIKSCNSVSLHIRRGDYITSSNNTMLGNVCSLDYYFQAIDYVYKTVDMPCFFIFSDDITWAKANLHLDTAVYIDWNNGFDSWQDMCLMSLCKHNINANSTFSWWGAWLNNNSQKIVIVPRSFFYGLDFSDSYPESWIKL